MKKFGVLPKLFISVGIMVGIVIAIITYTFAWFSASNQIVKAKKATFTAGAIDTFVITADEPNADYSRYMGETGIEYDGEDRPYYIEYNPFTVNVAMLNISEDNAFFTYKFLDTSFIKPAVSSMSTFFLSEEDLWDNFSMELHTLALNVETEKNEETGEIFRSENGFFRNIATGELLLLNEAAEKVYNLYIFFQGDVAVHLLNATHADISEKYTFDYCNEKYMFANFYLQALFNLESMHTLEFEYVGLNVDDAYKQLSNELNQNVSNYSFEFTGMSDMDRNGITQQFPAAELEDADGNVATEYYFIDWCSKEYSEETSEYNYFIYRQTTESGDVYTFAIRPLRGKNEKLYSLWGESPKVTLDYNYEAVENEESEKLIYYLRPESEYYPSEGYLQYDYTNQVISVYNPQVLKTDSQTYATGASMQHTNVTVPEREGFRFLGWSSSKTPSFTAEGDLVDIFTENVFTTSEDVTVYAIWEEVLNVTLKFDTKWGTNYATLSNFNIVKNEQSTPVTGSGNTLSYVLQLKKGESLFSLLSAYTATATATIGGNNRALTLDGWYFKSGDNYVKLTSSNSFSLTSDVELVARWAQRGVYTIQVDLYQAWNYKVGLLTSNYSVTGRMQISQKVEIDGYVVTFDGATTGTFTGSSNSTVTIANIPEGVLLSQILTDPTPSAATGTYIASTYDFYRWTSTDNNWDDEALNNKKSSITTINTSTVVDDSFVNTTLTNAKLYAFFDR